MISHDTFYQRLAICKNCEFWRSVCLKGHPLQSPLGCPIRKFEPVDAADYYPDNGVAKVEPIVEVPGCCGQGRSEPEIKPMSWPQVAAHLLESMQKWKESGFALVDPEVYAARIAVCKACPSNQYRWFQCRVCRCCVFSKAKLATEYCPAKHW